jgi:putative transposase
MSRRVSPSTHRTYGLAVVCRTWGAPRATIYRARHPAPHSATARRGPRGAVSDADVVAAIRAVLHASPFHGEGYRKVWRGCASPACGPRNAGCRD